MGIQCLKQHFNSYIYRDVICCVCSSACVYQCCGSDLKIHLKATCSLQVFACRQVKATYQISEVYPCFLCLQIKELTLIQVNLMMDF